MGLIRKKIHRILRKIVKNKELPDILCVNPPTNINRNVIYIVNHQCVYDVPMAALAVPEQFYVLVGKQRLALEDRLFFMLNGSIWVDRKNKKSRKKAKEHVKKLLRQGENILIFPEGTWNYHSCNLLLPLNWGCIEISKECNVPIIPFAMNYIDGECHVKWGDVLDFADIDKKKGIQMLENSLATLIWELYEEIPVQHRKDIPNNWWENEWQRRVQAYPKLDVEYEKSVVRNNNINTNA